MSRSSWPGRPEHHLRDYEATTAQVRLRSGVQARVVGRGQVPGEARAAADPTSCKTTTTRRQF
eukprot:5082773-Alexandrium_andersonii.AAC.1